MIYSQTTRTVWLVQPMCKSASNCSISKTHYYYCTVIGAATTSEKARPKESYWTSTQTEKQAFESSLCLFIYQTMYLARSSIHSSYAVNVNASGQIRPDKGIKTDDLVFPSPCCLQLCRLADVSKTWRSASTVRLFCDKVTCGSMEAHGLGAKSRYRT